MDKENLQDVTQPVETSDGLHTSPKPRRFWKNPRGVALFVAFVLLFSAIGGYTVAYLQKEAAKKAKNDFRLAQVDVESNIAVSDTSGTTRTLSNLTFTNKKDVDSDGTADSVSVYIRVAVIGNWTLSVDNSQIYAGDQPERGTDYYLQFNGNKDAISRDANGNLVYNDTGYNKGTSTSNKSWFAVFENGVTYYYYREPVAPGGTTAPLSDICMIDSDGAPSGYSCSVEFAVQAIQAVGLSANGLPPVTEAWGITVSDNILQQPA